MEKDRLTGPTKHGWLCVVDQNEFQAGTRPMSSGIQHSAGSLGSHSPGVSPIPPGVVMGVLGGHSLKLFGSSSAPYLSFSASSTGENKAKNHDSSGPDRDSTRVAALVSGVVDDIINSANINYLTIEAMPFQAPPQLVCRSLCEYIDQLAAKSISSGSPSNGSNGTSGSSGYRDNGNGRSPDSVEDNNAIFATRVASYVREVLQYSALVLNEAVLNNLQNLASALGALDDTSSDQLKVEISHANDRAQKRRHLHAPSEANQSTDKTPLQEKIAGFARSSQAKQSWIPPELMLDENFVTEFINEVAAFHQSFWRSWSPIDDPSLLFHTVACPSKWQLNPLVFDSTSSHFLGVVVANHALSPHLTPEERGKLLAVWVKIANELHIRGDIVGWVGIAWSLLQLPVQRLRDIWCYVPADVREIASREFSFEIFELERRASIPMLQKQSFRASTEDMGRRYSYANCVPYFGDLIVSDMNSAVASQLERMRNAFSGWRDYINQVQSIESEADISSQSLTRAKGTRCYQELLSVLLKASASPSYAPASPAQRMEASLVSQPQVMGGYRAYFYTQMLPLSGDAMLPLLFTECSPSFRLFPRQSLLLARRDIPVQPPMRRSNSYPPASTLATGIKELELDSRVYFERNASAHVLAQVVRDLLNVGTETLHGEGELIFKTIPIEDAPNRRRSSVIESLGRQSILLDSRRQSLQSLSQLDPSALLSAVNHSKVYTRPVVVKSASLICLIDVLVLGSAEFVPGTALDGATHMQTLLATYRSFCSPSELLAMLVHRIRGAVMAAKSLAERGVTNISWEMLDLEVPTPSAHIAKASQIVTNCLEILTEWVSTYFFDFNDDFKVLRDTENAITAAMQEVCREGYGITLRESAKRLFSVFVKQRYRIVEPLQAPRTIPLRYIHGTQPFNIPVTPGEPGGAISCVEKFIQDLDVIAADAFARISVTDWMKLVEILELQTVEPSGLYSYAGSGGVAVPGGNGFGSHHHHTNHDVQDIVPIQDIYSWMFGLLEPKTKQAVMDRSVPPCLKTMFKLHATLVEYFVHQISDPAIASSPQERLDRMAFMLKMLGVLRARMRFFDLFPDTTPAGTDGTANGSGAKSDGGHSSSSRVPAFLESVLVSAILRPESRIFAASWLRAGAAVATQFPPALGSLGDDDQSRPNANWLYIPEIDLSVLGNQGMARPITPDIGWMTERLAEIVTCVPNMSVDHPDHINFDKSRYVCNFVRNILTEFTVGSGAPSEEDVNRILVDHYYIFQFDGKNAPRLDKKALKESLAKDNQGLSKSQQKQLRVFTSLVNAELNRMKQLARYISHSGAQGADQAQGIPTSQSSTSIYSKRLSRLVPGGGNSLPSSVSSFSLSLNSLSQGAGEPANAPGGPGSGSYSAPNPSVSSTSPVGSLRDSTPSAAASAKSGRSRLGGLFKAVRPLSVLGGGAGGNMSSTGSLTGSVAGSKYSNSGSVDPSSLPVIRDVSQLSEASWRLIVEVPLAGALVTTVGITPDRPSLAIQAPGNVRAILQTPTATEAASWISKFDAACRAAAEVSPKVFGVPLDIVCTRENRDIPQFFSELLDCIEDRGLTELGLYRISGSLAAVQGLRGECDRGQLPLKLDSVDVNAIAGCVKLYLRELPEPLLTSSLFNDFVACAEDAQPELSLRAVVYRMPPANRAVLTRLAQHLSRVVEYESENKMGVPNLAIVFSMNFLPPQAMDKMGAMQRIVSAMITHAVDIFQS